MIVGGEVAVMFLDCRHFIAEPDGDLVNAFSRRNQKTRESVSHRMRRNPVGFLGAHIFGERRAKVVPIKPFSVRNVRPKHEGVAKSIRLKKQLKLDCERDRTFFTIFKAHGSRLSQVESAMGKVKPERARFDNFLEAETGMEAAKEDKSQFITGCFSNQPVAKIEAAEIFPCSANGSRQFHVLDGIATGNSSGLGSPPEEGANCHDIPKGGRIGCTFEGLVIETLNLRRCNSAGRGAVRQRVGKQQKFVAFR